ncbi:MAG: hypothetical protein SVR08_13395 [Spirochaetota bacterium]|nr:hypothetical protein [Spirochaetota bacterium]
MIKKIILKITFLLERYLLRGVKYQLLFIASMIGIISLFAGTTLYYASADSIKIEDAIWWAFLRLSDPGYLGDDKGILQRTISTIVTILGYVLFMGSLVAILTQWLNATIRKLESGLTPISLNGHFLILGWTSRTLTMVRQILLSEERIKRYLKLIKKSKLNIVILAEEVSSHIAYELKESLSTLWDDSTIIFRSGDPLVIEHLKRVDFINAGVIIIPGENYSFYNPENIDAHTLKIITTLSSYYDIEDDQSLPDFVTEIYDPKKYFMLESEYKGNISIITSNSFISSLIVQNVRHKGLSSIYTELLDSEGNEIYIKENLEFTEKKYIDIKPFFPNGILLGILRKEHDTRTPILNPEPELIIKNDDQLIVLAENYRKAEPGRSDLAIQFDEIYLDKPEIKEENITAKSILFLGWNSKVPDILNEFSSYKNEKYKINIFSQVPILERKNILQKHSLLYKNLKINHIMGDYNDLSEFSKLKIEKYDNIIMLASDRYDTADESDARTIMGFMMLDSIISEFQSDKSPDVLVELLEPNNAALLQNKNCELIVSSLIISYLLSQIALRKSLKPIYDSLFEAGDADIFFRSAGYFNMTGKEFTFWEIEMLIGMKNETAIGIQINSGKEIGKPILNPAKDSLWNLSKDDNIIVLSS